jgi:predicted GTPase
MSEENLKKTKEWEKIVGTIGEDSAKVLSDVIQEAMSQPPRIAVIGKAGVGKTTTINNLFSADWIVGDIDTGTKYKQEASFEMLSGGRLCVVDLPGFGEDLEQDEINKKMYREILPEVNVILYIMQANARDLEEDQLILRDIVLPLLLSDEKRLVVGLNKVDQIGPGGWIKAANYPSREQQKSIKVRTKDISEKLSNFTHISPRQIVYFSATKAYRLNQLGEALIIAANDLGWKLPIRPKSSFDDASSLIKTAVNTLFPWTKSNR